MQYLTDLKKDAPGAACRLETTETIQLQRQEARLLSRYTQAASSPCGLEMFGAPNQFSSSRVPQPVKIVIHGSNAVVSFPALSLPPVVDEDAVALRGSHGHWQVDGVSAVRGLATPQAVAHAEHLLFSDACLAAWNAAVSNGLVAVAAGALQGPSSSVWADLAGIGPGAPCTSMTVDNPSAGYCEGYTQNQGDGTWLQEPCASPGGNGSLLRGVWLDSHGLATPAAAASPDGTVPSLVNTPGSVPATTPSAATTSASPGTTTTSAPRPAIPTGHAEKTPLHSCSPGADAQNGVKRIDATTSCAVAQYLGSFTSIVGASSFRDAGVEWRASVSHAGGIFHWVFTTVGTTPSLTVRVFF